jgi:putative oxidoreductase
MVLASGMSRHTFAYRVLTGLLALTFVITGIGKLASMAPSPANFTRWGFSMGFMYVIGAIEVAGGVALLVPRLSPFAALLLAGTMFGAIRTGLVYREPLHIALPAALLVLLVTVIYLRRSAFTSLPKA